MVEGIDAKTRQFGNLEGEVGLVELFVSLALLVVHDVVHHAVNFLVRQRRHIDALDVTIYTDHGRHARRQVQVRSVILHSKREQLSNIDGH